MKINISTLIARDKLPVHTIPEPHEQGFVKDLLVYNCLGDLIHLENKEQKMQKKVKNMIMQKHLYIKNMDKRLHHQSRYLNRLGYLTLLYEVRLNELNLPQQSRMVKKSEC